MATTRTRWFRPRNIVLGIVALVTLLIGREVYLALTATPGKAVNFVAQAAALVRDNQDPGAAAEPNAWPMLLDAIQTLTDSQPGSASARRVDFSVLYSVHSVKPPDETHTWADVEADARACLKACKENGLYDLLARIASTRHAERPLPDGQQMIGMLLPELGSARQLARMNGARMAEAERARDDAELVGAFEQTLALGRIIGHQYTLIDHLVAVAIDALALDRLCERLTERPPKEATLVALMGAMDRQLPLPPLSLPLRGERLMVLDTIQWTHTDDGHGSGRLIPSAVNGLYGGVGSFGSLGVPGSDFLEFLDKIHLVNLASVAYPSKAATTRKMEEYFQQLLAGCDLPAAQRRAMHFDPDKAEGAIPRRYIVLNILIPATSKAVASRDQLEMDVLATRVLLGIELFAARNGRYPASLDELVPSVLPSMPIDPISLKPFGYRLLKPEEDTLRRTDGTPRPYLLYSLCADGKDGGGHMLGKNNYSALHNPNLNTDFVFNLPRPKPEPEDESGGAAAPAR